MPIQQTKKQDDLEKRLKILRSQVYGKPNLIFKSSAENLSKISSSSTSDTSYLLQDLLKTFILAGAFLGIQIFIFILLQNNLINLKF